MPRIVSFVFLGLWGQWSAFADLQPAKIFSDHMVLQRDAAVPVWGWADADTSVTVAFADQSITTKADEGGRWKLKLDPMVASATGRSLEISSGTRKVTIRDVLVGDVWFAGGKKGKKKRNKAEVFATMQKAFNNGDSAVNKWLSSAKGYDNNINTPNNGWLEMFNDQYPMK